MLSSTWVASTKTSATSIKRLPPLSSHLSSSLKTSRPHQPGWHLQNGNLDQALTPLSSHLNSSLITPLPPSTWVASTKISATSIRRLPPLSNHLSSNLITPLPSSTWAASTKISATSIKLASTLKSLELKPDNPTALINLGGIYQDLGNLDQALASTLKSLELA